MAFSFYLLLVSDHLKLPDQRLNQFFPGFVLSNSKSTSSVIILSETVSNSMKCCWSSSASFTEALSRYAVISLS